MRTALYDQVYLVPPVCRRPAKKRRTGSTAGLEDAEFSEAYRSANFPPGWYLVASFAVAVAGLVAFLF